MKPITRRHGSWIPGYLLTCMLGVTLGLAPYAAASFPEPAVDAPLTAASTRATAVVAGGCFWGVQAVFQHVRGVVQTTAGYAGGTAGTASYDRVNSGTTGHAESVQIVYDTSQISYGQLLRVFFSVAHDPTQENRQGPDVGPEYRSAVFYAGPDQQHIARAYVDQLTTARMFARRIVTQLVPLRAFYAAEAEHQDYVSRHPFEPYVVTYDRPKLDKLRNQHPTLFVGK